MHDADDYNDNNVGIVGDDARLLGCAKPPNMLHTGWSPHSLIIQSAPIRGEKRGATAPIAFHIRASMTTFVMSFSDIRL